MLTEMEEKNQQREYVLQKETNNEFVREIKKGSKIGKRY